MSDLAADMLKRMSRNRQQKDPAAALVARYCPDLSDEDRQRAEVNVRRYMEIVTNMAERIARERAEQSFDTHAD